MQINECLFCFGTYNFVIMGSTNDVCYFILKMFVMMGSTSDVWFLCLMLFTLLYLFLDKNSCQYLMRYIIFIYIM